jgi:hypothetical protein
MSRDAVSAWPPTDPVGLLGGDPHGCVPATAVRGQDGAIDDFILACLSEAGCRFCSSRRRSRTRLARLIEGDSV